ncbi:substrate-binding domain-containing protein [Conexibacter sp. JD483]|uniref:sugar ABC transporter substrate-binding protein n=1 Tax=unclassified Conexibacter TaxID=2627773 RepID=UPI002722F4CD|nr:MULTISPECIES: substrate-binding domain-containing protein [unclassified Conexibacter]MDO8187330.1 substrate-binding domain-containing protein [Conexibacter sp. CPCC 205706]MDO8200537.1 substrate-binding domain-containing protein [Conexibacter sp. CPCC 205762]MDR9369994.1 substrate-binding domain-containing protein [Conexibacter sp. JD483]
MKHLRSVVALVATTALMGGGLAACGSSSDDESTGSGSATTASTTGGESGGQSGKGLKIAFLMPCSTCADRFENQDKPLFERAVQEIAPGAEVIANNAEGDSARQVTQTESAITNGADVIVVSPLDEAAGAAISDKAQQARIPVVSYDGLITDGHADFYVSFDNEIVGQLQGEFLARELREGSTVAFINGDQSIAPGRQFKAGAHRALDPLIRDGTLRLGYEGDAQQFDPQKGRTLMEQALTRLNDQVDGVIAANDGLAGGVVNALEPRGLTGRVLVTGQDATDAGLQRILLGQQTMSVYKAIKAEAEAAARVAVALGTGKADEARALATGTTDNGAGDVPSILLDPVVVTKDNIVDTVFADGFTTPERVCTGKAAARCPQ